MSLEWQLQDSVKANEELLRDLELAKESQAEAHAQVAAVEVQRVEAVEAQQHLKQLCAALKAGPRGCDALLESMQEEVLLQRRTRDLEISALRSFVDVFVCDVQEAIRDRIEQQEQIEREYREQSLALMDMAEQLQKDRCIGLVHTVGAGHTPFPLSQCSPSCLGDGYPMIRR